jgi:hypothetical protein
MHYLERSSYLVTLVQKDPHEALGCYDFIALARISQCNAKWYHLGEMTWEHGAAYAKFGTSLSGNRAPSESDDSSSQLL